MQTRTNTIIATVQPSANRYDGYGYNEVGAATSDGSYAFSYDSNVWCSTSEAAVAHRVISFGETKWGKTGLTSRARRA